MCFCETNWFYSKNSVYPSEVEWLIWMGFGLSNPVRLARNEVASLPAGNGADDTKRFFPRHDVVGQRGVGRFVGQVLLAGVES
jgi:hypothetical protein